MNAQDDAPIRVYRRSYPHFHEGHYALTFENGASAYHQFKTLGELVDFVNHNTERTVFAGIVVGNAVFELSLWRGSDVILSFIEYEGD